MPTYTIPSNGRTREEALADARERFQMHPETLQQYYNPDPNAEGLGVQEGQPASPAATVAPQVDPLAEGLGVTEGQPSQVPTQVAPEPTDEEMSQFLQQGQEKGIFEALGLTMQGIFQNLESQGGDPRNSSSFDDDNVEAYRAFKMDGTEKSIVDERGIIRNDINERSSGIRALDSDEVTAANADDKALLADNEAIKARANFRQGDPEAGAFSQNVRPAGADEFIDGMISRNDELRDELSSRPSLFDSNPPEPSSPPEAAGSPASTAPGDLDSQINSLGLDERTQFDPSSQSLPTEDSAQEEVGIFLHKTGLLPELEEMKSQLDKRAKSLNVPGVQSLSDAFRVADVEEISYGGIDDQEPTGENSKRLFKDLLRSPLMEQYNAKQREIEDTVLDAFPGLFDRLKGGSLFKGLPDSDSK